VTLKAWLWIIEGHGNRHMSIRHLLLPINVIYSNHGPISYRFRDKRRCRSKIATLAMRMRGSTWPVSGECKIIISGIPDPFLLTVQLSSGYDDD